MTAFFGPQYGAPPQTQQVLLPYHSCPYTWDDLSLPRKLAVESLAIKSAAASKWGQERSGGGGVLRRAAQMLSGVWSMLWDQAGPGLGDAGSGVAAQRPVLLGEFELDRLQTAQAALTLPHIKVGVHADGPTRVLSIVDARNKTQVAGKEEAFGGGLSAAHSSAAAAAALADDARLGPWENGAAWVLGVGPDGELVSSGSDSDDGESSHDELGEPSAVATSAGAATGAGSRARRHVSRPRRQATGSSRRSPPPASSSSTSAMAPGAPTVPGLQRGNSSGDGAARAERASSGHERSSESTVGPGGGAFDVSMGNSMEVSLSLRGVGVSIVEAAPRRELLYLSVLDLRSEFGRLGDQSRVVIKVGWMQADNQIYGAYYPVMLAPRSWNRMATSHDMFAASRARNDPLLLAQAAEATAVAPPTLGRSRSKSLPASATKLLSGTSLASLAAESQEQEEQEQESEQQQLLHQAPPPPPPQQQQQQQQQQEQQQQQQHIHESSEEVDAIRPFAEFCLVSSHKFPSLDFVRYVSMLVLPMNLKLEPELVGACLAFVSRCLALRSGSAAYHRRFRESAPDYPFFYASGVGVSVGGGSDTAALEGRMLARSVSGGGAQQRRLQSHRNASSGGSRLSARDVVLSGGRYASNYKVLLGPELEAAAGMPPEYASVASGESLVSEVLSTQSSLAAPPTPPTSQHQHQQRLLGDISTSSSPSSAGLPATMRKLYIEELHIHPVKVHVSFSFRSNPLAGGGGVSSAAAVESGSQLMQMGASSAGGETGIKPLRFVLNAMGATLANVENAPLRLNALVLHNSLSSRETVMERILAHYRSQALRQAYLILGSVDLLGDPRGLVQNLGAGVLDFFYEPALGLVRSPKEFGAGIAKGTLSLFRRTVLGAATSATGFANGVSALFDSLSNDRFTGFKPRSVFEGVVQGIAGLVVAPMAGLQEEGLLGLGQGLLYGAVGLFVKPLAGALKLIKHVSVAIQSTIDPSVKLRRSRMRPPRSFRRLFEDNRPIFGSANRIMEPYDFDRAQGEELLAMVDHGAYLEEGHVDHLVLELPPIITDLQAFHLDALAAAEHEDARRPVELLRRASLVMSFYTLHEKRPLPALMLWKRMFLVATRQHLLYVDAAALEFGRSAWVLPLGTVRRVLVREVVQQIGEEDEDFYGGGGRSIVTVVGADIDNLGGRAPSAAERERERSADEPDTKPRVNPDLAYWVTLIQCQRSALDAPAQMDASLPDEGAALHTFVVFSWTEAAAQRTAAFVSRLAELP